MTKNEFLTQLMNELNKNDVADTADIISEYEQHFAFKIADGYSEAEIAAKLGTPVDLAAQFESGRAEKYSRIQKAVTIIGLGFAVFPITAIHHFLNAGFEHGVKIGILLNQDVVAAAVILTVEVDDRMASGTGTAKYIKNESFISFQAQVNHIL